MLNDEELAEALALAPDSALCDLAESIVAAAASVVVLDGPTVGTARLDVREPVEATRFGLIEVLLTRAEVQLDGTHGWAMRLGDDSVSTLAAALCDAEVQRGGPLATDVRALCALALADAQDERDRMWAQLVPTIVNFEELD